MVGMIHGSSPLARGLPDVREPQRQPQWIIPARAGFTRGSSSPGGTVGDHPRSRGVYGQTSPCSEGGHGSSPLARGLHLEHGMGGRLRRIIPARAGFTAPAACGDQRPKDHPRSRGVYHGRVDHVPDEGGSSPLARGLPGTRRSPPGRPTDHPRSRGVYVRMMTLAVGGAGSSPLARGLPIACPGRSLGCRIIPARAGFTWGRAFRAARCRDHPRSRGVYLHPASQDVGRLGSSPLARGLRQVVESPLPPARIIPARAGFT